MAVRVSVRSTVEQPAGKPAVIVPDVFPTATERDDLSNVHDIVSGHLPNPLTGKRRQGWLRLAMPTGELPAYIDPSLTAEEQEAIYGGYREIKKGALELDDIEEIVRGMIRLDELTSRVRVAGASVYFPRPEKNLGRAWPVESALAFTGKIALDEGERFVFGMHFASGNEHGWARVFDPAENKGESAKLQHEPGAPHSYEELLARLR